MAKLHVSVLFAILYSLSFPGVLALPVGSDTPACDLFSSADAAISPQPRAELPLGLANVQINKARHYVNIIEDSDMIPQSQEPGLVPRRLPDIDGSILVDDGSGSTDSPFFLGNTDSLVDNISHEISGNGIASRSTTTTSRNRVALGDNGGNNLDDSRGADLQLAVSDLGLGELASLFDESGDLGDERLSLPLGRRSPSTWKRDSDSGSGSDDRVYSGESYTPHSADEYDNDPTLSSNSGGNTAGSASNSDASDSQDYPGESYAPRRRDEEEVSGQASGPGSGDEVEGVDQAQAQVYDSDDEGKAPVRRSRVTRRRAVEIRNKRRTRDEGQDSSPDDEADDSETAMGSARGGRDDTSDDSSDCPGESYAPRSTDDDDNNDYEATTDTIGAPIDEASEDDIIESETRYQSDKPYFGLGDYHITVKDSGLGNQRNLLDGPMGKPRVNLIPSGKREAYADAWEKNGTDDQEQEQHGAEQGSGPGDEMDDAESGDEGRMQGRREMEEEEGQGEDEDQAYSDYSGSI